MIKASGAKLREISPINLTGILEDQRFPAFSLQREQRAQRQQSKQIGMLE